LEKGNDNYNNFIYYKLFESRKLYLTKTPIVLFIYFYL
jgi:hypothetical protein